ncbi:MAG: M56 family metallopeptidase [Oscillospiraceae bacterium]
MTNAFISILNMSITASYVALAVILVRTLFKKAPRVFSYGLWSVVMFRLVCPFSFESAFSLLISNTNAISKDIISIQTPITNIGNDTINNAISQTINNATQSSNISPIGIVIKISTILWLIGIVVLLGYSIFSYTRLRLRLSSATHLKDNIFETQHIQTPFVLGFLKPKIYLSTEIADNELDYILKHEQTHIKRFDYLIKPIAFLVVILHWFNPLIWVCYFLMSKDMEASCDESVIKYYNEDIRCRYSNSLLSLSAKQNKPLIPLAFGESNVKFRIKNILKYKKPAFGIIIITVIAVIIVGVGLIINPKTPQKTLAQQYLQYKTEYVGDNSKVSGIVNLLEFINGVNYDHFELDTKAKPSGITVYLKTKMKQSDYDYMLPQFYERNALIMFALIENVDVVKFNISDKETDNNLTQYTRDWANEQRDKNISKFAKSEDEFGKLVYLTHTVREDKIKINTDITSGTYEIKGDKYPAVESTPQLKLPYTIASGKSDLSDYAIDLVMTKGEYIDGSTLPAGGGIYEKNYQGYFELQSRKGDKVLSSLPLYFDGNRMQNFGGNFTLILDDYNNDGNPDFTIGQWGGSNGNLFHIFTINDKGSISKIDGGALYISSSDFSVQLEKTSPTSFRFVYYDNVKGENVDMKYHWEKDKFVNTALTNK